MGYILTGIGIIVSLFGGPLFGLYLESIMLNDDGFICYNVGEGSTLVNNTCTIIIGSKEQSP